MTAESVSGLSVAPAAIGKAFEDLQKSLREADVEFSTVSNNNVIILHSPETSAALLQEIVTTFTEVHPSRFFVVCLDPDAQSIHAHVSAVCQKLGQQKVCSEIVKATIPHGALARFPSILRAYLISGRTTEVFIADDKAGLELFPTVAQTADYVFFDSHAFKNGLRTVKTIAEMFPKVVDLEWLRLSPWRSAVRNVFERGAILAHLRTLTRVTIGFSGDASTGVSAPAVLMASWIMTQLKLDLSSVHGAHIHAKGMSQHELLIEMTKIKAGISGVQSLTFHFEGCNEFTTIEMKVDAGIVTEVNTVPPLRTARLLENDSSEELIKRFYLVGESVTNFGSSLKMALKILDASQ